MKLFKKIMSKFKKTKDEKTISIEEDIMLKYTNLLEDNNRQKNIYKKQILERLDYLKKYPYDEHLIFATRSTLQFLLTKIDMYETINVICDEHIKVVNEKKNKNEEITLQYAKELTILGIYMVGMARIGDMSSYLSLEPDNSIIWKEEELKVNPKIKSEVDKLISYFISKQNNSLYYKINDKVDELVNEAIEKGKEII